MSQWGAAPPGPSAEEVADAVLRKQERLSARRFLYDVAVAVAALAVLAAVTQGLAAWKIVAVATIFLLAFFRPRGDAAARREVRIEKAAEQFAQDFTDTIEVVTRAVKKMHPNPQPPPEFTLAPEAQASIDAIREREATQVVGGRLD